MYILIVLEFKWNGVGDKHFICQILSYSWITLHAITKNKLYWFDIRNEKIVLIIILYDLCLMHKYRWYMQNKEMYLVMDKIC